MTNFQINLLIVQFFYSHTVGWIIAAQFNSLEYTKIMIVFLLVYIFFTEHNHHQTVLLLLFSTLCMSLVCSEMQLFYQEYSLDEYYTWSLYYLHGSSS